MPIGTEASVAIMQTAGLVLARVGSLFLTAPGFSQKQLPMQVRAAFTMAFTCILIFTVQWLPKPLTASQLVVSIVMQVAMGFLQGLAFAIILAVVVAAGDLLDLSVGYAFAALVDPAGDTTPHAIFSRLFNILALLIFMAVGGHLWVLGALIHSMQMVPLDATQPNMSLLELVIVQGANVLAGAFQMAAPVLVFLALIDVVGAVMSKSVPQLQIMTVAFPIKICAGLVAVAWFLPTLVDGLTRALQHFYNIWTGS
ncbi:MAG: flagellar biosynthetic protein FliR [Armatimonadetes bacterium]|nr:flagellar biosynthetic protein FliR [Armatimonadota bacterium]